MKERNHKVKEYCEVRIRIYELYYKGTDENTDAYNDEMNQYDQKLADILKELKEE